MVVALQQGSRAVGGDGAFRNFFHGLGFVFAPGHEDDALGAEHGADAHGDGLVRRGGDVAVEIAGLTLAGAVGQAYHARTGLFIGAGLVEAHLALFADSNHQEVQVAGECVEAGAIVCQLLLGNGAVRQVDVLLADVHLVQQRFMDAVVAALCFLSGRGIVLVDGNHLHVLEGHIPGGATAGQLVVERRGRGACGEPQPEESVLVRIDGVHDEIGNGIRGRTGFRIDMRPNFFVGVQDTCRQVFFNKAAFVGQCKMFAHGYWCYVLIAEYVGYAPVFRPPAPVLRPAACRAWDTGRCCGTTTFHPPYRGRHRPP